MRSALAVPADRVVDQGSLPEPGGSAAGPGPRTVPTISIDRAPGLGKTLRSIGSRAVDVRRPACRRRDPIDVALASDRATSIARRIRRVRVRGRDDRTRPASVDELDLVLEPVLLAEGHERRQLRRLGT